MSSVTESEFLEGEVELALEPYRALLSEEDLVWMRATLRAKLLEESSLRDEALAAMPREDLSRSEVQPARGTANEPTARDKPKVG